MSPRAPRSKTSGWAAPIGGQAARFYRVSDHRRLRAMAMSLACAGFLVALILGVVGLRVQQVRLSYRLDALRVARTELEETRNRLRRGAGHAQVARAHRGQGPRRARHGVARPDQVRLAREFVPVGTGLTSSAPLTAAPIRTHHAVPREAHGSGAELASRPDGPRSSAGFAGAVCSRGEASEGGRSPPPSRNADPDARRRRLHRLRLRGPRRAARVRPDRQARRVHAARGQPARQDHPPQAQARPDPRPERSGLRRVVPGGVALRAHLAGRGPGCPRAAPGADPRRPGAGDRQAARLSEALRLRQAAPAARYRRGGAQSRRARARLRRREHAPVSQPRARRPRGGIRGHGWQGPGGSRAGVGRAPRGRGGAGPRRAGCPRPRDHGRAQGDQAVHGGAGRDAHPRRHAAVHRGEGGRRGVAAHALEGGARARDGSAHGRDPGAGDSPDVQPEQLRRRHRRRAAQPRASPTPSSPARRSR